MKKLLFIFIVAMPSSVVSMENGAIKLYSVESLKRGYEQLFPASDGSLNKGWGSPYGGITLQRSVPLTVSVLMPFFWANDASGDLLYKHVFLPEETGHVYYQPKITDITVANLLVYCQKHKDQMDQLQQQRLAVINNVTDQQRILGNQIDQLKRDQDTEDHQFTENTVLGRRRIRIEALKREIETVYNLRTADITTLRENNRELDRILWRHENQIDQLGQDIRVYNADAERCRNNIITLQNNSDNHSIALDRHTHQIAQLQQGFRDHRPYENEMNQFIVKKLQETGSVNEQDVLRNTHIKQLLEDVAVLKKTLHQWIPNTVTSKNNTSVACSTNVHHTGKTIPYITNNSVEEESTTSSCSTTDKIALKKY